MPTSYPVQTTVVDAPVKPVTTSMAGRIFPMPITPSRQHVMSVTLMEPSLTLIPPLTLMWLVKIAWNVIPVQRLGPMEAIHTIRFQISVPVVTPMGNFTILSQLTTLISEQRIVNSAIPIQQNGRAEITTTHLCLLIALAAMVWAALARAIQQIILMWGHVTVMNVTRTPRRGLVDHMIMFPSRQTVTTVMPTACLRIPSHPLTLP